MKATRYFRLFAPDEELARAIDFDALYEKVIAAFGRGAENKAAALELTQRASPRVELKTLEEINTLAREHGLITGFDQACTAGGLTFPPGIIYIPRFDYHVVAAHELGHLALHFLGLQQSERLCYWVQDRVTV